jgi:hypothetical protein
MGSSAFARSWPDDQRRTTGGAVDFTDPAYVDFALPQQELAKISTGFEVRVHTDAVTGREFKGKLTALTNGR